MTFNPPTLVALGRYWTEQGGVNLGVVGNPAHTTGYHLGADRLKAGDYSIQHPRDKAGLSNAASAIDLGKLRNAKGAKTLAELRRFSVWLVAQCQAKAPGTRDVREVIYSPDGQKVQRYSGVDGAIHRGPGNGDASHRSHTHISYFRDSQARDKVALFQGFFEGDGMSFRISGTAIGVATLERNDANLVNLVTGERTPKPAGYVRNVYLAIEFNGNPGYLVTMGDVPHFMRGGTFSTFVAHETNLEAARAAERERIAEAEAARIRGL